MNTDRQSYELDPILVPVRDDSGHDVGSCSVTLPDPEQHRAVAELVASERHYRLLSENASDVVCLLDMGNVMRWVSSSVESVLGWQPEDLLGTSPLEIVHPDDRAAVTERRVELSTGTAAGALELRVRRADGDFRWMSVHTRPTINAAGVVDGAVLGLRDVHDTVLARNALAESEHHYRLLSANATDAVFLTDLTGVVTWVSPAIRQVLGYDPADLVGSDRNSWVHPDDLPQVDAVVARLIEGEVGVAFEVRGRTSAGEYRWMSGVASIAFDLDGDVIGLIAAMRDITEQVAAREQAARNERMFHLAMDGAPQGMAVVALDGTFLQVNPALCAMLGRDEQWLLAHSIQDVMHPDDLDEDRSGRDELLRGAANARVRECRWRKSDNTELWVLQSTGLLRDEQELSLFYVSHVQDNTAAHRAKMELSYRASHDPLTGLINRDQLRARLSEVVNHPPRRGGSAGLLFCDLDFFKGVNDTYGHAAGDLVLRATAERISATVRACDIVARLGGDEFVVVLSEVYDRFAAATVAEKIREAVSQPMSIDTDLVRVTISIGIACAGPETSPDTLLAQADAALYQAKHSGRDQTSTYDGNS
ncbi:MAG: hypothetical protein QG671_3552 [Actinomycetota bacterium]|nr:hypothetical protein [Actinomycetota bacterium]